MRFQEQCSWPKTQLLRALWQWLRRNAQRNDGHVKMAKVSRRVPDTSVRGSRSYHTETKSKPACLHRCGAREKSGILNINTPIFFNSSARTGLTEQTYGERRWGHWPLWDLFFWKNRFFLLQYIQNRHPTWSTFWRWTDKKFKPCLPETVWKRFQQKNWHVYVQKPKWRSRLNMWTCLPVTSTDMTLKSRVIMHMITSTARRPYGARHHNWPLFVIAAILLSDVARRQLRYCCKAGNESYPTPLTACACDVRLLNYAWNNADWLTGDKRSWLSANHQRLRCNGPIGHSDVACNAQILRCGHAASSWSRSEDTLEEFNRTRVLPICPLQGPCRFAQCATSSCHHGHWVSDPACSRWPA